MADPSAFQVGTAIVAALAPKTHAPILLKWAEKYTDEWGREWLNTLSRILYFWFLIMMFHVMELVIQ